MKNKIKKTQNLPRSFDQWVGVKAQTWNGLRHKEYLWRTQPPVGYLQHISGNITEKEAERL